jgi:Fe-S oxidoreductase
MCADACHFYIATEDTKYIPILKAEPLKQAYKREAGPFGPIFRLFGLKSKVTEEELEEWRHLIYESCNLCGRCSLICPMGIDVAGLIEETRRAMADAGLAPRELNEKAEEQIRSGRPEPGEPYAQRLMDIGAEHNINIPLNLDEADLFVCIPRTDIEIYPAAVAALAKVLVHTGDSFTFRSNALVAENYGYYTGSRQQQRIISKRIIEEAIECNAKTLIVPECGHAYTSLRWEAADLWGGPLPFEVMHITEYLANKLSEGKLKVKRADKKVAVAFHDPCQLVRRGGVMDAPRALMEALGLDLHEMLDHQGYSFCCGGGGGVVDLGNARQLRYKAQELKLKEVDSTGAEVFLTSCSDCRKSFADAKEHFDWDKTPQSLVEAVADNLV